MKKILFKIKHFPQLSETFVTSQIIVAIKCGFDVKILVNTLLDSEITKQKELFEKYNLVEKIIIEDYNVPKFKIFRLLKAAYLIIINIRYLRKIKAFFKEKNSNGLSNIYHFHYYNKLKKFDIIHVQFGNNHQPFEIFKKIGLLKSKLIVSFHGHDAFYPIYGFLKEGYYDNLFKYGDLIVANTPYLANQILSIGCPKEKLKTIPLGVDISFFKPAAEKLEKSETINIITLGRLDKVKGQQYAIEAIEKLLRKGYNVKFTIIGKGEERENLEAIIDHKNLRNAVCLVGAKNHNEVLELFNKNDIFIFTSVAVEGGRRETQGLATLEAQACGLPAVVFDSGGVKYTLKEGVSGFVVPEYDIDAIVNKIELLINNIELRNQMSKEAIKFVSENYSQAFIDFEWCKLYNNIIKN